MPTDENRWKEMMIESGQMPDDKGYWHYNPQACEVASLNNASSVIATEESKGDEKQILGVKRSIKVLDEVTHLESDIIKEILKLPKDY